jgi:hypothetical protein
MNSYQLFRQDGTPSGVWSCGECHRAHAQTIGRADAASDVNRDRAEACCMPLDCTICGRPTERDVLGNFPSVHMACFEAIVEAANPPHPSMANPWVRLLRRRMSDISEDCYAAGWLIGNEYSLWRLLHGESSAYDKFDVPEEELEELRLLSQKAGGWIWTGGPDEHIPRLVSFEEWAERLAEVSENDFD